MSDDIHWIVEFTVKDGKRAGLEALVSTMVAATKANEPDTRSYAWYISADGRQAHVHERYAGSAAAVAHLKTFNANLAERLLATVDPVPMVVYGDPSRELRAAVAGFGAVHMAQIDGFAR